MNFDKIEKFEQLSFAQWIALGNLCGGLENVKSVLQGHMSISLETINCLDVGKPFKSVNWCMKNIRKFFQTRADLIICENFQDHIIPEIVRDTVGMSNFSGSYYDLVGVSNDSEITDLLPEGYLFEDDLDDFLGYLATILESQQDGTNRVLLDNGKSNIFYVQSMGIIYVRWFNDCQAWICDFYKNDNQWEVGSRVFTPIVL